MPSERLPVVATVPTRPKGVHRNPCVHCPSKIDGDSDPDMRDLKAASKQTQIEFAFACGWRPEKFCRGYVDHFGLTDEEVGCSSESTTS